MSDAHLTELSNRLAQGDRAALAELYQRYASVVFGVVLRLVRDRAEAEELTQETFVEAWRRATQYQPERANVAAWLVTIAKSRAIDRLRLRAAHERALPREAPPTPVRPPDEVFASAQARHAVRRRLERLPVEQRALLELAWDEGLSQSEIARRTGLPLGTVKTRTRTALLTLRDELQALK